MALIKCEDCEKEFSGKAKSCPGCGCPALETADEPISAWGMLLLYPTWIVALTLLATLLELSNSVFFPSITTLTFPLLFTSKIKNMRA